MKLRTPPPSEGLSAVVAALTEKEFEPLSHDDMKAFPSKVLFLVALASARHISEPHALSVEPAFLIERAHSFNLAVNAAFLLKKTTDSTLSGDIELQAFHVDFQKTAPNELKQTLACLINKIYTHIYSVHVAFKSRGKYFRSVRCIRSGFLISNGFLGKCKFDKFSRCTY